MDHIPDEDMPAVDKASHEVVQEAVNAGVWVFGGGLESQKASVVAIDGTVTDGPYPGRRRRILRRRCPLTRGGAAVGCQDRRCLALRSRGPGVHARPHPRQPEDIRMGRVVGSVSAWSVLAGSDDSSRSGGVPERDFGAGKDEGPPERAFGSSSAGGDR